MSPLRDNFRQQVAQSQASQPSVIFRRTFGVIFAGPVFAQNAFGIRKGANLLIGVGQEVLKNAPSGEVN